MKKIFPYKYQIDRFLDLFLMFKLAWPSMVRRPRPVDSENAFPFLLGGEALVYIQEIMAKEES